MVWCGGVDRLFQGPVHLSPCLTHMEPHKVSTFDMLITCAHWKRENIKQAHGQDKKDGLLYYTVNN